MPNIFKKYNDRETLERIKRWPSLMHRFDTVRIYSAEHGAYWRGTGQGYTTEPNESNIWDIEEAFNRTKHCCPQKQIQFVSVDIENEQLKVFAKTIDEEMKEIISNLTIRAQKELNEMVAKRKKTEKENLQKSTFRF